MSQDNQERIDEIKETTRLTFQKLEPKAGDIITITVPESYTADQAMALANLMSEYVPEGVQALMLQSGVTLEVLTEEEMNMVGWTRIQTH